MKDYTCKDTWCHTLAEYDSDYCEQHEDLEFLEEKAPKYVEDRVSKLEADMRRVKRKLGIE